MNLAVKFDNVTSQYVIPAGRMIHYLRFRQLCDSLVGFEPKSSTMPTQGVRL